MTLVDGRGSDAGYKLIMSSNDFEIEKNMFQMRFDLKLPQTKVSKTVQGVLQGSYIALFMYKATSGI